MVRPPQLAVERGWRLAELPKHLALRAPAAAARPKARRATASRARSLQTSRDRESYSYFGPVADQVVIDTGQFDRFRVIAPEPLHQGLNRRIEIEDQAAGVGIPYHTLQPEKRRYPPAPRDRRDQMQAGRRIKHEIAGRQLDLMGTVEVLDDKLAAVIFVGFR